jgi:hypothetical protein
MLHPPSGKTSYSYLAHYDPSMDKLVWIDINANLKETYSVSGCVNSTRFKGGEPYIMRDLIWVQDRDLHPQIFELISRLRKQFEGFDFTRLYDEKESFDNLRLEARQGR